MRLTLLLLLLRALYTSPAPPDPVKCAFSLQRLNASEAEVHVTVHIEPGWHIYAQAQPQEAIATPTTIRFSKNPLVKIPAQQPKELGTMEKYTDLAAGIVQYQYAGKVEFVQAVTLKPNTKTNILGTITYQACTEEMCLPPKTLSFSIPVE